MQKKLVICNRLLKGDCMSTPANTKLKLLYLMQILLEKTDEDHQMSVYDLINALSQFGISAERKAIYTDLELLQEFGLDIVCRKGKANQYFIGSREFEVPELKLLVDAVQSSKFITHKKSTELIRKLEKLASVHEAKGLHRQVFVADRAKTMNEGIYYNVDLIHQAIRENKQISFQYFKYNTNLEIVYGYEGERYIASPFALSWADDNYYLVAYYERYNGVSNFRVDRMNHIEVLDAPREHVSEMKNFNLVAYTKKSFGMYSGETVSARLRFDNSLINVIVDRFGKDVRIIDKKETHFSVRVDVVESRTFLAWLFMFGTKAEILEPVSLRDEMKACLIELSKIYE